MLWMSDVVDSPAGSLNGRNDSRPNPFRDKNRRVSIKRPTTTQGAQRERAMNASSRGLRARG